MRYTRPWLVVLVIAAITSSGQAQIEKTGMLGDDFYDRLGLVTDPAQADELLGEWFTKRTAGVLYVDVPEHAKDTWRKGFFAVPTMPYAHYLTGAKDAVKRDFIVELRSLEQVETRLLESPSNAAGYKYQELLRAFTMNYGRRSSTLGPKTHKLVYSFREMNYARAYDELTVAQDASKSTSLMADWLSDRSSILFFAQSVAEVEQTWKATFSPTNSEMLERVFLATPSSFRGQLVAEMRALKRIEDRLRMDNSAEAKVNYYIAVRNFAEDWETRSAAAAPAGGGKVIFQVDVETVDRQLPVAVNGHFVFYVPRGLKGDPSMFQRYSNRSLTEKRPFWAGWYIFWSQHDAAVPEELPAGSTVIRILQDAADPIDVPEPL